MTPKMDPLCLGARSCGLTTVAALWNPEANRQTVIRDRAGTNSLVLPL